MTMSGHLLFAIPTLVAAVAILGEVVVAMAVGEVLAVLALVVGTKRWEAIIRNRDEQRTSQ